MGWLRTMSDGNRQVMVAVVLALALLAGWVVVKAQSPEVPLAGQAFVAPEAQAPPAGEAFTQPAGEEYRATDVGSEAIKASLAPLWTWDGDVGTYADGKTKVRMVSTGGTVTGFEIVVNESAISDACLQAQLLYGISVDGAGVESACAGMWTREWAEAQGARSGEGN